ncbi:MAG: hypothetical protein WCT23_10170, partial [Candidatus Neomarinimicrobiota bacterium]
MSTASITSATTSATVTRARVQVPAFGVWWADVSTSAPLDAASGAVTITLADVTLSGTIVAGGARHGRGSYRIAAGAAGWRDAVAARAYFDDRGVAVADVLRDAAADAGEALGVLPTTRRGAHYARSAGPASRVLHEVAPRAWYVDFDGVTQFGARATTTYTGDAARVDDALASGRVDLVTDVIATLVPGVVIDDLEPATDVEYVLTASRLTTRVFAGPRSSRELDAFRRILDAVDPWRAYRAAYEYRVVSQDGGALDLQPVRSSANMPDLERVAVRLSSGLYADHVLGSLVTVVFLDGDPSRPRVITGDDADAPGFLPDAITIDADAAGTVELGSAPRL